MSAAAERAADQWWSSLTPERRAQIHKWVDGPPQARECEGQIEIPINT